MERAFHCQIAELSRSIDRSFGSAVIRGSSLEAVEEIRVDEDSQRFDGALKFRSEILELRQKTEKACYDTHDHRVFALGICRCLLWSFLGKITDVRLLVGWLNLHSWNGVLM